MLLRRRRKRFCGFSECGALLVRKEGESTHTFMRRQTCDKICGTALARTKSVQTKCFCGKPREVNSIPYCSYEHRVIAIKCKKWGFEPDIKRYEKKSKELYEEQKAIDDACRPLENVYLHAKKSPN